MLEKINNYLDNKDLKITLFNNKLNILNYEKLISIITKQVKMRKDAIEEFKKANRDDLISSYENEIKVLEKYLPEALSEEEVIKIIDEAFNKINPISQKEMGLIMKEVSPKVKGRCDMGKVSNLIKDKLSNI